MLEVASVWTFIYLEKTETLNGTGVPVYIGALVQPLPPLPRQLLPGEECPVANPQETVY